MRSELISILLGFIEGFGLIISPCILPILPIVLASSLVNSKKRPLGIISGFTIIFALFAFFSRQFVQYIGINLDALRHISYLILLLLGLIMISSYLSEKLSHFTQRLAHMGSTFSSANNPQGGFYSRFFFRGLDLHYLDALCWSHSRGCNCANGYSKNNPREFFHSTRFRFGRSNSDVYHCSLWKKTD